MTIRYQTDRADLTARGSPSAYVSSSFPSALCGRHGLASLGNWLRLVGELPAQEVPGRSCIILTGDEAQPIEHNNKPCGDPQQQGWLPYRPSGGLPPELLGKHFSRGPYQTSQLRALGSPYFGSRVEG